MPQTEADTRAAGSAPGAPFRWEITCHFLLTAAWVQTHNLWTFEGEHW